MGDPLPYNDVDTWDDSNDWMDTAQQEFRNTVSVLSGEVTLASERFCETVFWWDTLIWLDINLWLEEDCVSLKKLHFGISLTSGNYAKYTKYGSAMFDLLPIGEAWPPEAEDTVLKELLYGIAEPMQRFENQVNQVIDEIFPDNAGMFLTDWERIMQLPKCDIEFNNQQRSETVEAMFNISPYSNSDFLEGVAEIFGFNVVVSSGLPLPGNRRNIFKLKVLVDNPTEPIYFRAGVSSAGDPLVGFDFGPIECLLNFFKPAHTYLEFEFTYPDGPVLPLEVYPSVEITSGTYTAD